MPPIDDDLPSDDPAAAPQGMHRGLTSYGDRGFSLFLRKAFIKGAGFSDAALDRPVIGIADTGSDYNPCHGNAPQLIEAVKRGVMLAGGLPMRFPTISVHESFAAPTSMFLRNLMSMDTEEMLRAQPMDAVVLIGGCDKTVPAQLMGAASAGLPAIQLITGSMLTGSHRGERVGACTDCRRYWGKFRAGEIDAAEKDELNHQLVASVGTCSVMGTASTMACIAEALGMTVPGGASPPAVTADRIRIAEQTGAQAVAIARAGLTIAKVLTPAAFENALRVLLAIGGSTNGLVHLAAIAGRMGLDIDLQALDRLGRETPVLLDLKPSGQHYMEHFHAAGGMAFVTRELLTAGLLHGDTVTVAGSGLGAYTQEPWLDGETLRWRPGPEKSLDQDILRPVNAPFEISATGLTLSSSAVVPSNSWAKFRMEKQNTSQQRTGSVAFKFIWQNAGDKYAVINVHGYFILHGHCYVWSDGGVFGGDRTAGITIKPTMTVTDWTNPPNLQLGRTDVTGLSIKTNTGTIWDDSDEDMADIFRGYDLSQELILVPPRTSIGLVMSADLTYYAGQNSGIVQANFADGAFMVGSPAVLVIQVS